MTNKSFKFAGVSKFKNQYKVRFCNDIAHRTLVLSKNNTDIQLFELPRAMTKPEVVTFLKTHAFYQNPEYRLAIDTADTKYNPTVKVRAKRKSKAITMDDIIARIADNA
ncbi:hypothetical protein UFOVP257_236 [uncultured Caudovirales phage]|uniref:Uncharacterized protein n=1 Tax=uncultured Caudovirales phage TaxID=2100421 RepID=A0A6J5LG08_9CAUD|nr:hypothetical protein UFOVP257_236 [uncultured Caudovirales phage]